MQGALEASVHEGGEHTTDGADSPETLAKALVQDRICQQDSGN